MGEALISRRGGGGSGYKSVTSATFGLYVSGTSGLVSKNYTAQQAYTFNFSKYDYVLSINSYYTSVGSSSRNIDTLFIKDGKITIFSDPYSSSVTKTTAKISGTSVTLTFPYATAKVDKAQTMLILER